MITKFGEIYIQCAGQVSNILRDKSEMFGIGFRNGLISNSTPSEYNVKNPSSTHLISPYDHGFSEGMSYAAYKLATYQASSNLAESKKSEPDVIVGFVIQNYDFSFDAIEETDLAKRHTVLVDLIDPADKDTANDEYISDPILLAEEDKLNSLISYLYKSGKGRV